jgi:hypothetical protein
MPKEAPQGTKKLSGRKLFAVTEATLSAKLNKRIPSNDRREEVSLTHGFVRRRRRGAHIQYRRMPIVCTLAFMLLSPVHSLYIR